MSWLVLSGRKENMEDLKNVPPTHNNPDYFLDERVDKWRIETKLDINLMVNQVLSLNGSGIGENQSWLQNPKNGLRDWQMAELESVKESESGIRCLLTSWLITQKDLMEGTYCNATWDNVYCWPPTPLGTTVNRTCLEAFTETQPLYAKHLEGHGYRVCLANGSWLWDGWTNYTECADSYDAFVDAAVKHVGEQELVTSVQYILSFVSLLSLICLTSAVAIFYYFRVLWCDRVTIHIHLMVALILRYIMLFIITEPHIFQRETNYRSVDFGCKGVLIIYLYATLTSINWMFIQGIYINGKLTTNIFNTRTPFKVYYTIGWLLPFVLMSIYTTIMHFRHDVHCWSGYAQMNEIWIIICPIILALIVNFFFLINILRIITTSVNTPGSNSDARQIIRAAKATIFLFPLLGINNLLFLYNPGGDLHKYFVVLNTIFGSTQGIFVAIVYCYLSRDVRAALRRVYFRFMARRNAKLARRRACPRIRRNARCTASSALIIEQPVNSRNNRRRAVLAIRPSQLSPTNCNNSNNSSRNGSQSHLSINPASPKSNSPSKSTVGRETLHTNNIHSLQESSSTNSFMSAASHRSFCRICANSITLSVEYSRVHNSCRTSLASSSLVSMDQPWHSCSSSAAGEMLGLEETGRNYLCGAFIPLNRLK